MTHIWNKFVEDKFAIIFKSLLIETIPTDENQTGKTNKSKKAKTELFCKTKLHNITFIALSSIRYCRKLPSKEVMYFSWKISKPEEIILMPWLMSKVWEWGLK